MTSPFAIPPGAKIALGAYRSEAAIGAPMKHLQWVVLATIVATIAALVVSIAQGKP